MDRWITANYAPLLASVAQPPLVVDLGYGASPVTTVEFHQRLRAVRRDVEVIGLEIDPLRVAEGARFLTENGGSADYRGLTFALGGFELPVSRPPLLVRAFNVLRQYEEDEAWRAWSRLCDGLTPNGVLIEGTCDEIGRLAVWVALDHSCGPEPCTITFAARVSNLTCPSDLAERLPKTLIHRNVSGERIHSFFIDFDRSWAIAAPQSVFGPRQRWIAAIEHLALTWPVITRPPAGGRSRWRLGEVTIPWAAIAPDLSR